MTSAPLDGYCDNGCFDYVDEFDLDPSDTRSIHWGLRMARTTLTSDGQDPFVQHEEIFRLLGNWWEDYQVQYEDVPAEFAGLHLDNFINKEWSGWLTNDQLAGRMCPPGTYTRLWVEGSDGTEGWIDSETLDLIHGDEFSRYSVNMRRHVWMSDTPTEVWGHLQFFERAHGDVLILGLGLGMDLPPVLAKDCVTRVDVVELDDRVTHLIEPRLRATLSDEQNSRLHIWKGNAFDGPARIGHDEWDTAWDDIWPTILMDENRLDQFRELEDIWPVRGWFGHWSEIDVRIGLSEYVEAEQIADEAAAVRAMRLAALEEEYEQA